MSSKKSGKGQASSGPSIRKFRSDVAKLKSLGLVSAKVDARSQKMTRYMRSQVKKFEPVLTGKAKVVHAPSRKAATDYREGGRYITKGKNVVIPVDDKAERLRWDKKANRVVGTSSQYGERHTREYLPKPLTADNAKSLPVSSDILYTIPIGRSYRSFDTFDALQAFMFPYETSANKPYLDWQRYVIVERYGVQTRVSRRA